MVEHSEPTIERIKGQIKRLKNHKTPDKDKITGKLLKTILRKKVPGKKIPGKKVTRKKV